MTEKPERKTQDPPGAGCTGGPGTGPDNPEAHEQGLALRRSCRAHPAERVTALRGLAIARPRAPKSAVRRQTLRELYGKDPEIPYVKFEAALRDLVCSFMERQDRMNEEIFYQINDLRYRIEGLEADRQGPGGVP
ncbi:MULTISPECIES: hypothetical protein [Methanoregula]|uniref:Uncharacterized protein n=1 Tax=Methanoregula formicica (strain DSM 22288 / NBRC 105244 / SMSP) TaxID=593750 RepID=L0HF00_METFS|nr:MULTISPECIES: hypothetical protein [Methanoregula]AGB03302.1 hypothetical protein Metfor_2298 [Methanoregula formicica SMSP]MDD5144243.1 hypothetical protein [Methanoregula sp.]